MDDVQHTPVADEKFFSSNKSQMGKSRLWMWSGVFIGTGVAAAIPGVSIKAIIFTAIFVLPFTGLLDWFIRKQLKVGQALIMLNSHAIESPNFSGKLKRYLWSEIVDVSIESTQNVACMHLRLAASGGKSDKRSFWSGINYAQPYIPLSTFSPEDQERLVDAVNSRIGCHSQRQQLARTPVLNQFAAEREFQKKLKALAPHPWVTYALIGINIVVWGLTLKLGAGVLQAPTDKLLAWGGNAASEAQQGEWWRLLSATFLHSGVLHLAMNMMGLIGAGLTVERIYGHRLFLLIYLGSGLMGSALSLHFSAQQSVSVGASGAVFGVAGALLVAVFQHRKQLPKVFSKQTLSGIGFFVIYSLIQGFGKLGIDNAAHVGGLVGGCLLAFILPERFDVEQFRRQFKVRSLTAFFIICSATISLAATAPLATFDQGKVIVGTAFFDKGLKGFDAAIKALQKEELDVKAGKLNESQRDERGRSIHAPVFRKVFNDLTRASLPPGDPREPLLKDIRRLVELIAESLAMQSIVKDGSVKPEPVNPVRMTAIEVEVGEVNARIKKLVASAKVKQAH